MADPVRFRKRCRQSRDDIDYNPAVLPLREMLLECCLRTLGIFKRSEHRLGRAQDSTHAYLASYTSQTILHHV